MKKYSLFIKIVAICAAVLMLLGLVPAVFADDNSAQTPETESRYISPSDGLLQDVIKEDAHHKIVTFGDEAITSIHGNGYTAEAASGTWGGSKITSASVDSSTINPYTGSVAHATKLVQTTGSLQKGSYKFQYKSNTTRDISGMNFLVFDLWIDNEKTAAEMNAVEFCFELTSSGEPDKAEDAFFAKFSSFTTLTVGWNHVVIPLSKYGASSNPRLDRTQWNFLRVFNNETTGLTANREYTLMLDNIYFWDGNGSEFVEVPEFTRNITVKGGSSALAFVSPSPLRIPNSYDVSAMKYVQFDFTVPEGVTSDMLDGRTVYFELSSAGIQDKYENSRLIALSTFSSTGSLSAGVNHITIPLSILGVSGDAETTGGESTACDYTKLNFNRMFGFQGADAGISGTYSVSNFRFTKSVHSFGTPFPAGSFNVGVSTTGGGSSFNTARPFKDTPVDITGMKYMLIDLTIPEGVDLEKLGNVQIMMEMTSSGKPDNGEVNNGGATLKNTLISGYTLTHGKQTLVIPIENMKKGATAGSGAFDQTKVNFIRWYNQGAVDAGAAGTYRLENLRFWDGEYDASLSDFFTISVGDTGALTYTGAQVQTTFNADNAYGVTEDMFTTTWYSRGGVELTEAPSKFGSYMLKLVIADGTRTIENFVLDATHTVTIPSVTVNFNATEQNLLFDIGCTHQFTYTCTAVCEKGCGYSRAAAHDYSKAVAVDSNQHNHPCAYGCGTLEVVIDKSTGKPLEYTQFNHRWDAGTLQSDGTLVFTCTECGYEDAERPRDAKEHTVSFYEKTWGRIEGSNDGKVAGWMSYDFRIGDTAAGTYKTFDLRGMRYMLIEFWADAASAEILSKTTSLINTELTSSRTPDHEENQAALLFGDYCVSNGGKLAAGWNLLRIPLAAIPQHSEANRANMAAINYIRFFNNWAEPTTSTDGKKANVKFGNIWFWDGMYDDGVMEESFIFRTDKTTDASHHGSLNEHHYLVDGKTGSLSANYGRYADRDAEIIYKYTLTGEIAKINSLVWNAYFVGNDLDLDASFDGETWFDLTVESGKLGKAVTVDVLAKATAAGVTPTNTLYIRIKDNTTGDGNGPVLHGGGDVRLVAKYNAPAMNATLTPAVDYVSANTAAVDPGLVMDAPAGTRTRVEWLNAAGEVIAAPTAAAPYTAGTYTIRVTVTDPVYYKELTETVTVAEGEYMNAIVKALNVSVDGKIGFKFYLSLPTIIKNDLNNYNIVFLVDGEAVQTINASKGVHTTATGAENTYMYECPLAAAEMTKSVSVQIVTADGNTAGNASTAWTVKAYAEQMYNLTTDAKTKTLLQAMLRYGSAAQTHFNVSTGDLADNSTMMDGYTGSTVGQATEGVKGFKNTRSNEDIGVSATSYRLYLQSETMMAVTFTVTDTGATFTFTDGAGEALPYKVENGKYIVYLTNISAPDLGTTYTIKATNEATDATYTFTTSALSYVRTVFNSATATSAERNLHAALYDYYMAASANFN